MKIFMFMYFFTVSVVNGQKNDFILQGKIAGLKNGKIYLIPVTDEKRYYGSNLMYDSSKIFNGTFMFKIKVKKDISAYNFLVRNENINGTTGMVLIEPKNQMIIVDTVNNYVSPVIRESNSQNELKIRYEAFFNALIQKVFFLNNIETEAERKNTAISIQELADVNNLRKSIEFEGDSLLYLFSSINRNSDVTLWKLIEKFKNFGFKQQYFEIYQLLSNRLKASIAGRSLKEDLLQSKILSVGKQFPSMELLNKSLLEHNLNDRDLVNSYTLVDFWFSSCQPCIRQFPELKEIYNSYKNRGFQVIGISTDQLKQTNVWKTSIVKYGLEWPQYIDLEGKQSKLLGIDIFPTNFLINSKGKIIFKNMTSDEIKVFLRNNL